MQAGQALLALVGAALLLSACSSSGDPHLMNLRAPGSGPDEFAIQPAKPLSMPQNMSALPAPTPGGSNLADTNPIADAVTALGGKPSSPAAPVPAADRGLVNYADRYGPVTGIRDILAREDLAWRKAHGPRFTDWVFGMSVYFKAYKNFELDAYKELASWRAKGVATPSAPPGQK